MLVKIKNGTVLKMNGATFNIIETSMEDVSPDGASDKVSFTALSVDGQVELKFEFGHTTIGIGDRDLVKGLSALMTMLSNG